MIKSLKYQQKAVNELVEKTIDLLNQNGSRKKLIFKAPTGSGKTVMASELLDRLTTELSESDSEIKEVAFIWIAPNKLHQQSYMKMKNYFTETRVLTPVMYDELDHSIDGYIKPGEIFFVNWESINKDKNVIIRDTENSSSLYDLTRRTQEDHGLPIIVVIDEEHMFGGRAATQSEKVLKNINPKVEIRISATPITIGDELVNISRDKVVAEEMIKDGISINPLVVDPKTGQTSNDYLLEQALQKRIEIKKAYESLNVNINPLLLIQLPNDNSETLNPNEAAIIDQVKNYLSTIHNINVENGKLAIWLATEKQNLEGLEENSNMTEALLFKQAIALGWDCPRASVLLIFREMQSFTFTVQTVGRILRMPEQHYYPNEILNHGFVYTNLSQDKIEIVADDINYISKALLAYRRAKLNNVSLTSVYSERLSAERNRLGADFYKVLIETISNKWQLHVVQLSLKFSPFEEEDIPGQNNQSNSDLFGDISRNRQQAEINGGINFKVSSVQVQLIQNVEIIENAGTTYLDDEHITKYMRNALELNELLSNFCSHLLHNFEKVSILTLRGYLYQMMENLFGVFENDAPKIILYNKNQNKFAAVIESAINNYLKILNERRIRAKSRSFKSYKWEIPEVRDYNEQNNHIDENVVNHALQPFVQINDASNPEKHFEAFLEDSKEYIDWWYKNGDEGKQHYSIEYTRSDNSKGLFYVDFVIRMKNGQIFLFDTKSINSDFEGPNKHNALIDYMTSEKNASLHLKGGIIIEVNDYWKYSPLKIENTFDTTNWDSFFPELYK